MSILITNGIALIQEPKILKPKLCTDLISHIESSELDLNNDQNVQCNSINLARTDKLHAKVFNLFLNLRNLIRHYLTLEVIGDSGYQLRKIHGTTRLHIDGPFDDPGGDIRNLSCIVALNGDFRGGEVSFPKQDFKYQMNRGDILIFPPYHTHPHQVFPPHAGTYRYTINTWFYDGSVGQTLKKEDPYVNKYP